MNADELRVGEKYRYHIKGEDIHSYRGVSEQEVQEGRAFFTRGFGVRITNIKDLDALDSGVDAYYARPDKSDIPREAVLRAVALKKTYFPYLKWKWNVEHFNAIPYAAPIPNLNFGAPPLEARDLNISLPVTGVSTSPLNQQFSPESIAPTSGESTAGNATSVSFFQRAIYYTKKNWWLVLLPVPIVAIILIKYRKK